MLNDWQQKIRDRKADQKSRELVAKEMLRLKFCKKSIEKVTKITPKTCKNLENKLVKEEEIQLTKDAMAVAQSAMANHLTVGGGSSTVQSLTPNSAIHNLHTSQNALASQNNLATTMNQNNTPQLKYEINSNGVPILTATNMGQNSSDNSISPINLGGLLVTNPNATVLVQTADGQTAQLQHAGGGNFYNTGNLSQGQTIGQNNNNQNNGNDQNNNQNSNQANGINHYSGLPTLRSDQDIQASQQMDINSKLSSLLIWVKFCVKKE